MELLYDVKDGVATLTLNRPDKLNAVTDAMRQGLARYVEEINHDPGLEAGHRRDGSASSPPALRQARRRDGPRIRPRRWPGARARV